MLKPNKSYVPTHGSAWRSWICTLLIHSSFKKWTYSTICTVCTYICYSHILEFHIIPNTKISSLPTHQNLICLYTTPNSRCCIRHWHISQTIVITGDIKATLAAQVSTTVKVACSYMTTDSSLTSQRTDKKICKTWKPVCTFLRNEN